MSEQDGNFSNVGTPQQISTLPQNVQRIRFEGFETLNTKPSQQGIGDQEMYVCDGFMPLGKNNLRSLRGLGDAIYTTNATRASGWIYFATNPANGATVTINGVAFTFVNDGTGYPASSDNYKINIIAFGAVSTISNLFEALVVSPTYLQNPLLNLANYYDNGGSISSVAQLTVVYKNVGTDGNTFTLAASAAVVSGATLTGGTGDAIIDTFNFNTLGSASVCMISTTDGNITQVNMDTLAATILPAGNAIGFVKFLVGNASNGDTVTLNGVVFTFVNDSSGWPVGQHNYKINIAGSAGGTEFFFTQALTTGSTYLADPALNVAGYTEVDAGGGDWETFIRYATPGAAGNAYTLAKSGANIQLSAATLVGGSALITSFKPDFSQWSDQYIIIVAPQTNGYFLWDGTNVFKSGGMSPVVTLTGTGAEYTSAPTVTARGGTGTGATLVATVSNGSVVSVSVSNPGSGWLVGEDVALTFKGGGSDNQASATATLSGSSLGIASVIVTDGGAGYSDLVQINVSGSATTPAQLAAVGQNGVLTGVTVINPGIGYTSPPVLTITDLATGAVGTGAAATPVMTAGQIIAAALTSQGSGYVSPPTITVVGDGVNAVMQAQLSGDVVDAIAVINPGSGYTRAVLQFSGGNNAASATALLMPFGVSGDAVEIYQGRVWVGNGRTIQVTAPGSPVNFQAADGATAFESTDAFLQQEWTQFTQSNGFLYLFGDSSINYVSGVQTSGNPPITTFSNLNVDPQVGTPWHSTVQWFGRNLVFANPIGVYVSYGGAVTKVSDALDGIYTSVPQEQWPPDFEPSAAVANIFGIKVYILVMPILDQVTGEQVVKCLCWDGKRWFTSPQEDMTNPFVATQKLDSQLTAYCSTDGTSIKPMFNALSTMFTRYLYSKLWDVPGLFTTKMSRRTFGLININNVDTGTAATGQITFTQPSVNDTVTLNGSTFTFIAGASSGYNVHIDAAVNLTIAALLTRIAAQTTDANLIVASYAHSNTFPTDTLTITYLTNTLAGNSYTLQAAGEDRITPVTRTLTGGSEGSTLNVANLSENDITNTTNLTPNVSLGPNVFGPIPTAQAGVLQGIGLWTTMSDVQINTLELINQVMQSNA